MYKNYLLILEQIETLFPTSVLRSFVVLIMTSNQRILWSQTSVRVNPNFELGTRMNMNSNPFNELERLGVKGSTILSLFQSSVE